MSVKPQEPLENLKQSKANWNPFSAQERAKELLALGNTDTRNQKSGHVKPAEQSDATLMSKFIMAHGHRPAGSPTEDAGLRPPLPEKPPRIPKPGDDFWVSPNETRMEKTLARMECRLESLAARLRGLDEPEQLGEPTPIGPPAPKEKRHFWVEKKTSTSVQVRGGRRIRCVGGVEYVISLGTGLWADATTVVSSITTDGWIKLAFDSSLIPTTLTASFVSGAYPGSDPTGAWIILAKITTTGGVITQVENLVHDSKDFVLDVDGTSLSYTAAHKEEIAGWAAATSPGTAPTDNDLFHWQRVAEKTSHFWSWGSMQASIDLAFDQITDFTAEFGVWWVANADDLDHGALGGLIDDDHLRYARLMVARGTANKGGGILGDGTGGVNPEKASIDIGERLLYSADGTTTVLDYDLTGAWQLYFSAFNHWDAGEFKVDVAGSVDITGRTYIYLLGNGTGVLKFGVSGSAVSDIYFNEVKGISITGFCTNGGVTGGTKKRYIDLVDDDMVIVAS